MNAKFVIGALVAICSLGCAEKKSEGPETANEANDEVQASGSAPAVQEQAKSAEQAVTWVPESDRSKHFATVASKLDLGGIVFGYIDIDGDVENIADGLNEYMKMIMDSAGPNADIPPELAALDLRKLAESLGLASVDAIGLSSFETDGFFRNKLFLHTPMGRKGLLKMLGRNAAPYAARTLAPADADLIYERDINLAAIYTMFQQIARQLGGEEAERQFAQAMGESFLNLGITVGGVLGKFDTKMLFVARTDSDKRLRAPQAPVEFPATDILISIDNVKWLVDLLLEQLPPEAKEQIQQGEGFKRLQLPPMLPGDLERYQPVIHFDETNGRLLAATQPAWLEACLSGDARISDKPDFKKAMEGLPSEGNGLFYCSPRFTRELREIFLKAIDFIEQEAPAMELNRTVFTKMFPDLEHGVAGVSVNYPDGILWASNSKSSSKEISTSGSLMIVGVLAGIAVPVFGTIQKKARMNKDLQIMKMTALALRSYAGDSNGLYPDSLDEILPDIDQPASFFEFYDEEMTQTARVLYVKGLTDSSPANLPLLIHPFVINGQRAVIYCDGSGRFVDAATFKMPTNLAE